MAIWSGSTLLQRRFNPLPLGDNFGHFSKQSRPISGSSWRAAWSGSTLFAHGNMIYLILQKWTWQVISLFHVQTWKFIYIIIHSGWSLAWIFMKERVKWICRRCSGQYLFAISSWSVKTSYLISLVVVFSDEVGALVFDVGSYSFRAGYAGEDTPKVGVDIGPD